MAQCYYCKSDQITKTYTGVRHKVVYDFGPFDIFVCDSCGSMGTLNKPTVEELSAFYSRYNESRPEWYRAASQSGALNAQYSFYAKKIAESLHNDGSWVDIGAGHGEVANKLAILRPENIGTAVDIGGRPPNLADQVRYHELDMNLPDWRDHIEYKFGTVYSIAVWEHVRNPDLFAKAKMSLLNDGGTAIFVTPDFGSLASRVLRKRWPYFEPGEHISIPTKKGARICLERMTRELGFKDAKITVSSLNVGYSISYIFEVLRLKKIAKLIPPSVSAPAPTGILIAKVALS